jgi:hypothetical protein
LGAVAKAPRGTVDCGWSALQLQKSSDRCLVQADMHAGKRERTPELFISEARPESQSAKVARPALRIPNRNFGFKLFLVTRPPGRRCRSLEGHQRTRLSSSNRFRTGRRINSKPKQSAGASEVGVDSIVERVPFENTSLGRRTYGVDFAYDRGYIVHAKLNLDFAFGTAWDFHGGSIVEQATGSAATNKVLDRNAVVERNAVAKRLRVPA